MKSACKCVLFGLFCLVGGVCLHANQPTQKIFLFLKEPVQEQPVTIQWENGLDFSGETETLEPTFATGTPFSISYNKSYNTKRTISIQLAQSGNARLEVFDFYGKRICTLFEGFCDKTEVSLPENASWDTFLQFRGVAFFILSLDDVVVLKKMVPKVD